MKKVVVGGSKAVKIVIAILAILVVVPVVAVVLWLNFGIRPYDKLLAQVTAMGKTDAEKALLMYPKLLAAADSEHISVQDRSKLYLQYGRLQADHGLLDEAIKNFQKSAELSKSSWRGPTEAAAILEIARARINLMPDRQITQSDIKDLKAAEEVHPSRESGKDNLFWPSYDLALGQMHMALKEYPAALESLQRSMDEFAAVAEGVQSAPGVYLQALLRQGKYGEANDKFIEFYTSMPADESKAELQYRFRQGLANIDNKKSSTKLPSKALLKERKFAELDSAVAALQNDKTILPDGTWIRGRFYAALDSTQDAELEATWKQRVDLLRDWVKARPDSAPARIALGRLLISYGWKARGTGYSDTVSEESWKLFSARLGECKDTLMACKSRPAEWYTAMQLCALGLDWDATEYNKLVDEGLKKYPTYDPIILNKCYWLQPRWKGAAGEFEKYITDTANKRGGIAGDVLYARAAWSIDDDTVHNVLNETKMQWPRVKSGTLQIIKDYPDSVMAKGMLSILAVEVNDLKTAKSAFATSPK